MAKLIIEARVAYPGIFRETLEAQAANRRAYGERAFTSGVEEDNHNVVHVICDWPSVDSARSYRDSASAKADIAQWHAVGTPQVTILRESSND